MNEATATLPREALVAEPDPTPEEAALVNEIVSPPPDPRAAKIADLNQQVDEQRKLWESARAERSRLAGRKHPRLLNDPQTIDAAESHNAKVDALIKGQCGIEAACEKEIGRLQGEIAKLDASRTTDRAATRRAKLTSKSIDETERALKSEQRRLRAEVITTEAKRVKADTEVKKTILTLGDFQRMRVREAANPDPLRPGQLRGRDADIKLISERLDAQKTDLRELTDRLTDLQTRQTRVEVKLLECVAQRRELRLVALVEKYDTWAKTGAPILGAILNLYSEETTAGEREQLGRVARFPMMLFNAIRALPKAFFINDDMPGEIGGMAHCQRENFHFHTQQNDPAVWG